MWTFLQPTSRSGIVVYWGSDRLVLGFATSLDSGLLTSEDGGSSFTEIEWGRIDGDDIDQFAFDGNQYVISGDSDRDRGGILVVVDGTAIYRHIIPESEDSSGIAFTDEAIVVARNGPGLWVW